MSVLATVGRGLVGAIRLVVDLVISFFRDLMLEEYRDGRIRTAGLPAGVRVAVGVSIVAVLGLLVSVAFADAWRTAVDPMVLPGGQTLRGTLVPEPLIPLSFALIAIGAALCLSGALRASIPISIGVLAVYLALASFVHGTSRSVETDLYDRAAAWSVWAVIAVFVAARFLKPRPTLELCLLLGLVGVTFANAHSVLVATDHSTGAGFLGSQTQIILANIVQLSIPVLVIAALDVVDFGVHVARWGVGFVDRRLGQVLVLVALVLFGGKRLYDLGHQLVDGLGDQPVDTLQGIAGSIVLVGMCVGGLWWVEREARRRAPQDPAGRLPSITAPDPEGLTNATRRFAIPTAICLLATTLVGALLLLTAVALPPLAEDSTNLQRWLGDRILDLGTINGSVWWDLGRAAALVAVAVVLTRRDRPLGAAFLVCVAAIFVFQGTTFDGRVLEGWVWSRLGVDLVVVGTILGLVVWWALRRQLTDARCEWALFLLAVTTIFRGAAFFSDPFSVFPQFLAISTVGAVLFGLAWGFATNGSWANEETRPLPRLSRVQLLIGYQLLSAAILHWFVVTHDLPETENLTTDMPQLGNLWLGQPLILALLLTGVGAMLRGVPVHIGDFDDSDEAERDVEGAAGLETTEVGR